MKKPLGKKHMVLSFLGGALFFSGISFAADATTVTPNTEALKFYVDGEQKVTSAQYNNQGSVVPQSFTYSGTTYVPIRHVSDLLGNKMYWEPHSATISVNSPVVEIKNAKGESIGTAMLIQDQNNVNIKINVKNLPAGKHGIHVHQSAITNNDFATAGSHLNPGGHEHGRLNPKGQHTGDLPNLEVAADGTANATMVLPNASLEKGDEHSLLGASIIIHAAPDDEMTDPTGNSGDRIAGGNIPQ